MSQFEDIFKQVTNTEWLKSYEPFKKVAELKFYEDMKYCDCIMPEVHDIAVSYYIMYLVSSGDSNGTKSSESLGDYSYSKTQSPYDILDPWIAKYREFLREIKNKRIFGVDISYENEMTSLDGWRHNRNNRKRRKHDKRMDK